MGQNASMLLPALLVMLAAAPPPKLRTETRPMMGTSVTVTLVGGSSRRAREGFEAAFAAFTRVNEVMNEWRPDSALSEVNRRAGDGGFVMVPEDLCAVLKRAAWGARETGGLFDPTWAALRGLWRFGTELSPTLPEPAELKRRCALISHQALEFSPETDGGTPGCGVRLARAGMQLGLGGIAKGWAVDRAVEKLRALGFRDFFVRAGGDFYAAGKKGRQPWRVGIRDPRGAPDSVLAVMEVTDAAFSTSGDYENFFVLDGRRYHHLIDPRTCYPATASRSVTALAPSAVDAEVVTKSVFILGGPEGLALAAKLGASVVLVTAEGEHLVSPGLEGTLRTAPDAQSNRPWR